MKINFKSAIMVLSLMSLTSCIEKKNAYSINQALAPYNELFLTVDKINGSDYSTDNLILEMVDIYPVKYSNMVGYCTLSVPKVSIDSNFFAETSQEIKTNLIVHEMGYCLDRAKIWKTNYNLFLENLNFRGIIKI